MDSISKYKGSNDRIIISKSDYSKYRKIHNIYEINLRKSKLNDIGLILIYHFRRRKQLKILQSAEVNKVLFDPQYIGGVIIKKQLAATFRLT
jgi:hypothetical protein